MGPVGDGLAGRERPGGTVGGWPGRGGGWAGWVGWWDGMGQLVRTLIQPELALKGYMCVHSKNAL